ncbi:porin family protein, partial [Chryseobacterium sp. OSA05B]|uniref:porin family protein n=1 Tax=Chryseobacterium sp. OSA05B TaxID=2862650 RepID=UPI001CBB8CDE
MKKSIIIIATGLMFSATVKAQTGKHEIRIGYSEGSSVKLKEDVLEVFTNAIVSALLPDVNPYVQKDSKQLGVFGLGYRNQITDRLKVGGDLGYMKSEQTFVPKAATTNTMGDIKKTQHLFIAMPVIEYSYIKTPWLNFYGSAAAGVNLTSSTERKNGQTAKDSKVGFAYQVSPAGLRV